MMPRNIKKDKNLSKILGPVSSHFSKGHLWDILGH